jgi:hypothetical protein
MNITLKDSPDNFLLISHLLCDQLNQLYLNKKKENICFQKMLFMRMFFVKYINNINSSVINPMASLKTGQKI